jgi:A/G-specific adenine glycosylase
MHWHRHENTRQMPWKGEKDPYRIWLSEIILQQTRVEQGWEYYERFIRCYPTIADLAAAPEQEVFKLWEGLGYYSRCRNLIHTAGVLMDRFGGRFPRTYEEILSLKGVGTYTAAAIVSFAFDLPHAVVDGNVIRVLSRISGWEEPVDQPGTRRKINELAEKLLDRTNPSSYNQAMMDFGATVCKPQNPLCASCPMQLICEAHRLEKVTRIPLKTVKPAKKSRWFYYFLASAGGKVLVRERTGRDIWKNLYELVLVESDRSLTDTAIRKHPSIRSWLPAEHTAVEEISALRSQQLTHQHIRGKFIRISVKKGVKEIPDGYRWVGRKELKLLAFPKYIISYLQENRYI